MQYTPEWIKRDPQHYPRVKDSLGVAVEDLSPAAAVNLDADRSAFVALMRHIKARDSEIHTVIMVQVENEPGLIGTTRDHSPDAEQRFDAAVPVDMPMPDRDRRATWQQAFGNQADEMFSAYDLSRYIESIAAAGKHVYPLPMYVNVWMRYKGFTKPGHDYLSGGATWNVLSLWKHQAPHIDLIGTDVYTDDFREYRKAVSPYQRADNPPWISESHYTPPTASYAFDSLARGGIGFSVFGIDDPDAGDPAADDNPPTCMTQTGSTIIAHAANFSLLAQADSQIARGAFEGRLWSAVELPGQPEAVIALPDGRQVRISFGISRSDGGPATLGADRDRDGRVLVMQEDAQHFLVMGFDAQVQIEPNRHIGGGQALRVEEGSYQGAVWHRKAIWNGDETDYGLNLGPYGHILRVILE